jgi:L-ribulose-5-phosphate 4-epimerase
MDEVMEEEGVIKFRADHNTRALLASEDEAARALIGWRTLLWRLGVIGQDPPRYGGAGFGNVSARVGKHGDRRARPFVVTGTQTQAQERVDVRDFAVVTSWDEHKNHVTSGGPALPSSESLTHAALYDASAEIRAVFHVHAPEVFRAVLRGALAVPSTPPHVDYGTPAMAQAVLDLWRTTSLPSGRVLVMRGHQDGVVSFGKTADEAGHAMTALLARAALLA